MTAPTTLTGLPTRHAAHPLANRERRTALNYAFRARRIPVKVCSQCLMVKALKGFARYRSSSDGLSSYCRDCRAREHAQKQATDPVYCEMRRAASLAYNATHIEERRAYSKKRSARLGEENKARHAERIQDPSVLKRCAGQCQRILPETEFRLNRRARDGLRNQCKACADATRRARRACQMAYGPPAGQVCYLCGELMAANAEIQVDHLVPQSLGGPDTAENVRWTHGACNRKRSNKPLTSEQVQRALAFGPISSALCGG